MATCFGSVYEYGTRTVDLVQHRYSTGIVKRSGYTFDENAV